MSEHLSALLRFWLSALAAASFWFCSGQGALAADHPDRRSIFKAARGPFRVTRPSPEILMVEGRITAGDDKVFADALTDQVGTIVVNSGGGDVIPALKMAARIRARNLRVAVDGACVSSCANYLFVAGRRQVVLTRSVVLWHGGVTDEAVAEMTTAMRTMLADAHASPATIAANVERTDRQMRTAMRDQARLYRAVGLSADVVENLPRLTGDARPVDGAVVDGQPFIFIDYAALRCAGLTNLGPAWAPAGAADWRRFKQEAGMEGLAIGRSLGLERRLCRKGG
ncbi:hypothetical protein [Caulobacter sp. LARHSG274]